MISKAIRTAILVAGSFALGGCPSFFDQPKTEAPVKKAPAPDYQAAASGTVAPPANLKAICYNANDLVTIRSRMLHQELVVATLQCQTPSGARAFEGIYSSYLGKFNPELSSNARSLQDVARRKRLNVDVVVTEFSNRMAQRAPVDKEFCTRSLRALEWVLDPKVTSLSQAPPPYDLGPEMNMHPCP